MVLLLMAVVVALACVHRPDPVLLIVGRNMGSTGPF
jgi:hypothetical protein